MKRFLCGFLLGAILFCIIGAMAASYIANPVDFKVLVNGSEFVSDPPALEVEGRTYLPLRAIGDALGVPVNWNEELRQAEVGNSAPVAQSGEYSRQNPAPLNTVQQLTVNEYTPDYTVAIRVIETKRGDEAAKMIKEANMFNSPPESDYEYILAKIAFSVIAVEDDKALNINGSDFNCFSSNNERYNDFFVSAPEPTLSTQLYTGGNVEGYVVFGVKKDDPTPKIVFGQSYDGTGGIWFALQ